MKFRRILIALPALALALLAGACCNSVPEAPPAKEFSVHKVYGDHMVLQREKPIKVSGDATAGEYVTVSIAGKTAYAVADANGAWVATLPAMKAGGPYVVSVAGAAGTVEFQDVLIGEVWLGSGQSNMEWNVRNSLNSKEEIANANYPNIRLYNATSRKYVSPGVVRKEVVGPGWQVCSPATVGNFSAVAYFFGRQIHNDLNVPVGLVSASWGGTRIEPWISLDGFRSAARMKEIAQIESAGKSAEETSAQIKAAIAKAKQDFIDWEKRFYSTYAKETAAAKDWKNSDFDDSKWEAVKETAGSFPDNVDGVGWYRYAVNIPADWAGKELKLSLGAVDDCDETFFNGSMIGSTGTNVENYWAVPRNYKVPGNLVKAGRNVIAVRVSDMFSTGGLQGGDGEKFLTVDGKAKIMLNDAWRFKLEFAADLKKIGTRPDPYVSGNTGVKNPSFPATLYNSMINPWIGYPMRGFLWYQGESNASAPQDYITLQHLLVSDWRRLWNDRAMPFLFVQLAAYEKHTPKARLADDYWKERAPLDPTWAAFREAQEQTLRDTDYTGMAVTMDVGDHSDIHPINKQDVGYRLAKEAERICYGMNIVSAGPYYKSMYVKGDKIVLSFTNVGSGLDAKNAKDGKLNGFAIAGKDGKYVWADAMIDGETVVVSSPAVKEPAKVRYGWVSYRPDLNFFNKEGFPASPFRTDRPDYIK